MKKSKLVVIAASLMLFALVSSCQTTGGAAKDVPDDFEYVWTWGVFTDAGDKGSSRCSLVEDVEEIDGTVAMTYSLNGEVTNQFQYGYAGWYAYPDDPTMERLQAAKGLSFKVLGDGQTYFVMVSTSDITDFCYHRTTFTTKKDQVMTVNVKMGSLQQPTDWGIRKRFNPKAATQIQWQTTNNGKPGTFKLKIWDLKLN